MANYNNYSISRAKGKFYLKSAEPQEGYEKITYGTEGKVTYHKYFDRIQGVLKYFDQKDVQTKDGKKLQFLEVTLVDGDNYNKVSVPLKNSKGNFTDEVKAIVSALNGADVGEEMTMSVKTTPWEKDGKSGENLNVYLNYVNRKNEQGYGLSTGFIPFSEIPQPEKDEDEDLGITWDWKPVNKFWAQKIKEVKSKFENSSSTSEPKEETNKQQETTTKPEPTEEYDDLPF